jgi:hypothetical protein
MKGVEWFQVHDETKNIFLCLKNSYIIVFNSVTQLDILYKNINLVFTERRDTAAYFSTQIIRLEVVS